MKHTEVDCLRDMLVAAREARQFVGGMSCEEFVEHKMAVNATIRSLEMLGEACRRLPRTWRVRHSQVPWQDIAGMRDRLIHDYGNVNYSIVWHTVTEMLAPLETTLEELINEQT